MTLKDLEEERSSRMEADGRGPDAGFLRYSVKNRVLNASGVLELLRESFLRAKVIRVGAYDYIVHPLLDGVPAVEPELLEEVVDAMSGIKDMGCDLIVAPEAMALPLAAPLSLSARIPYVVVRKRAYGLEGEIRIDQSTGYSNGTMFLNGVRGGDKVVVVDDVLSRRHPSRPHEGIARGGGGGPEGHGDSRQGRPGRGTGRGARGRDRMPPTPGNPGRPRHHQMITWSSSSSSSSRPGMSLRWSL